MRNWKSLLSLGVTTALAFAALAAAGDTANDEQIKAAIEHKLDKEEIRNGGGPAVEVVNGNVVLSGKVKSVWSKNEAVKLASETDGVNGVEDKLEIAFGESEEKVAEEVADRPLNGVEAEHGQPLDQALQALDDIAGVDAQRREHDADDDRQQHEADQRAGDAVAEEGAMIHGRAPLVACSREAILPDADFA